ncbi:hypothetical protein E1212_01625 [Jiangella ureilytica]|uniref:DUF3604 domain-containing protein n=1 Tax=Jiangella ureilytica TaxID=2530374 RepID=A0A4R4S6C0_9ACTN|nr:hypothetical protein [Jiangella ureilytica]TDC56693.1 hypothetical protein E1212_01625 [Jiangella ureilytica]
MRDAATTENDGTVSRRTLLATAGGAAAAGLALPLVQAVPAAAVPARSMRPVSMAMHIHGSFSEGPASYETHLRQARLNAVDVIWWTDHEFRVGAHDHRREVRFEGLREVVNTMEWTWTRATEGAVTSGTAEFVDDPHSPDEPGKAMRLTATGTGWGILWYSAASWNQTYTGSLADTTIQLDVLAEQTGPGRELVVEINSSYHPARGGRAAGRYLLQYRIGGSTSGEIVRRAEGLRGHVEIPAPQGRWQRVTFRPVDDLQAIWPDLVASDNSMHQLRLGVRVAGEAPTRAVVDRLRIDYGRRNLATGADLRREVLARYADEFPDVVHYEAWEVSLVRHLNWIGGDLAMPALPSPPRRNNDPDLTAEMIEFMHAHGALAQWNHPLDVATPEELVRLMIERNCLGADLMEIGRTPFEDLRRVFDAAARNALFITGVGVSDDHGGQNWAGLADNNITYVWAASTAMNDLVDALRAGRAWWVDPVRWRGAMDIEVAGRRVLGSALVTRAARLNVRLTATGLPAGGALHIVESPVDYPGVADPSPATTSTVVPAGELEDGRVDHLVVPGDGAFVRLQARDAQDRVIGESNPFWILRDEPPHGIPAARRLRG